MATILAIATPCTTNARSYPLVADTLNISTHLLKDSLSAKKVPLGKDTVKRQKRNGLEDLVTATAKDSTIYDINGKKVYLYKGAKVVYQDLELEAGYISIDYETKEMFACGIPDSTGTKVVETPKFKQGSESYAMETINYNFESKKAKISHVVTKQGEGFLHSEQTKLMPDKSINIKDGKYTTCDDPTHPHFYMFLTKAKVVPKPDSKVIFGPAYMVIEDVPMPLFLPFGFFPQISDRSSGILFPSFGEDASRGFSVTGLGYYLVFGEHADLATTVDYYSLGSWAVRSDLRYTTRYKFDGGLTLNISNTVIGDKGSTDYKQFGNFAISWRHQQAPQVNPTSRFNASVNVSSPTNSRYNGNTPNQYLAVSASSNISYSKTWEDSPFNFSINLTHSQQMRDSTYSLGLPTITFDMSKFSPFKSKNSTGKRKLYEDFSVGYGMRFDNSISFKSSDWGKPGFYDKFQNGVDHRFTISLPTLSLLKVLTLSPGVTYGQQWHFQSTQYEWNTSTNKLDTLKSPSFSEFGLTQAYNFSAGINTRLYGLVQFKGDPLIKAIRHVFSPTINISYSPNLKTYANGWRTVQTNAANTTSKEYNIYDGQKYSPSGQGESGSINLSLGNTLEMKLRNRKDTTGTNALKLKLLEAFDISAYYNLLADSMNLSTISISGRSNILDKFSFNFGFTLDPYNLGPMGTSINSYYWTRHVGLGRLTNFNLSFGYTLSGGKGKGVDAVHNPSAMPTPSGTTPEDYFSPNNTLYYVNFAVPWSVGLDFSYSMNKSYPYNDATKTYTTLTNLTTTLGFRGDVSLTKNWKIGFTSGYDLQMATITTSSLSVYRDLHCFEFNFTWIPIGFRQSWNFGINVKGSALRDALKYKKQSSFYDHLYGY